MPRLIASAGDLRRVFFVGDVMDHGIKRCFDPAIDMEPLMEAIQQIGGIRLLVIDPIVSAIQGDSHKNAEVRRGLQPLVQFCNEIGCAILGITHFSKGTGGKDPVERISGSIAFGALARIVYVTAKLPKEDQAGGSRIICRSKSNIGPDQGGFRYGLEQRALESHPEIMASKVILGDHVEGSARELLERAESHRGDTDQEACRLKAEDQ